MVPTTHPGLFQTSTSSPLQQTYMKNGCSRDHAQLSERWLQPHPFSKKERAAGLEGTLCHRDRLESSQRYVLNKKKEFIDVSMLLRKK